STLKQYKNRERKLLNKHQKCLSNNQNRKLRKKITETAEELTISQADESIATTLQSKENTMTTPQNNKMLKK
ncbi:20258_t:CDS:2, partial [Gigaspora rosea]